MKKTLQMLAGILAMLVAIAISSLCTYAKDENEPSWVVTQYGDYQGDRMLCYTVESDTGLIIVDGGQDTQVDMLREIIKKHDNHVDAWFLTHPHSDHISSFLEIYKDPQGITIDHVYTPDYPSVTLLKKNASWDYFEILDAFRDLSIPQHTYLYAGDTLEVIGLKVDVISAYSAGIDKVTNDLMNSGSLVFRLSGKEESMMFCGDVASAGSIKDRKRVANYVLKHCDDVSATYIQMSHHGFRGMTKKFYKAVNPKGAFMDSPEWLLSGENPDFSSKPNYDMMTEMGVEVYTYETAPNSVTIH